MSNTKNLLSVAVGGPVLGNSRSRIDLKSAIETKDWTDAGGTHHSETTIKPSRKGAMKGAAVGACVAGPVGALIGGVIGGIFGENDEDQTPTDKTKKV